jgi:sugar phosphate isomerase/epimerase
MIEPGLVSVTFRGLEPAFIVDLVRSADLTGIEWGGDIHVPHGSIDIARTVRQMTLDAGLVIPSYGSYYRVGHSDAGDFEAVLATGLALGAPVIRVWAGRRSSAEADAAYWDRVIADANRIATSAQAEGVALAFEYHGNTLTDTLEAALRLLQAVDPPGIRSYWQLRSHLTLSQNLAELRGVETWLSHIHIQSVQLPGGGHRLPMRAAETTWTKILKQAARAGGKRFAMLEFVKDDLPERFLEDAATLKRIVAKLYV